MQVHKGSRKRPSQQGNFQYRLIRVPTGLNPLLSSSFSKTDSKHDLAQNDQNQSRFSVDVDDCTD